MASVSSPLKALRAFKISEDFEACRKYIRDNTRADLYDFDVNKYRKKLKSKIIEICILIGVLFKQDNSSRDKSLDALESRIQKAVKNEEERDKIHAFALRILKVAEEYGTLRGG